jgi:hypothetical protein
MGVGLNGIMGKIKKDGIISYVKCREHNGSRFSLGLAWV